VQKNAYFYDLKCRKKAYYFRKPNLSTYFFDPNVPIFGFSRLAALSIYVTDRTAYTHANNHTVNCKPKMLW